MHRALATISLALMLAACNASTRSADAVRETAKLDARLPDVKPPAELLRQCPRPVRLMRRQGRKIVRALSAGETERLWRTDRLALIKCGADKQAIQSFYATRDSGLAGDLRGAPRDIEETP